jgi:hypothetical protein
MTRTSMPRLALLLAASLATLFVALALTSARASASPFCGGQTINNHQTCFGAPRTFRYVVGTGTSTGVCVGYNEFPYGGCSSGAGQQAAMDIFSYGFRTPRIIGNSPNNTTVWSADAF